MNHPQASYPPLGVQQNRGVASCTVAMGLWLAVGSARLVIAHRGVKIPNRTDVATAAEPVVAPFVVAGPAVAPADDAAAAAAASAAVAPAVGPVVASVAVGQ